jgi:hypothetical protein
VDGLPKIKGKLQLNVTFGWQINWLALPFDKQIIDIHKYIIINE